MTSDKSGGASSEQPSDQSSPTPDSWSQPAPDSWVREPAALESAGTEPVAETWPAQAVQRPTSFGPPAGSPWPGYQSQQPTVPGSTSELSPGQTTQQLPPPGGFAPAAADPWGQPSAQDGPFSQPGSTYPAPGQYPPTPSPSGQYGYPQQYFNPAPVRNNPFAITALVLGIVQFVLGLALVGNIVAAIPAIIFGALALKQIRLRGERGRGMAIAGLVLGILGVLYFVLIILIVIGVSSGGGSGSG
jgi:hypothetical protein